MNNALAVLDDPRIHKALAKGVERDIKRTPGLATKLTSAKSNRDTTQQILNMIKKLPNSNQSGLIGQIINAQANAQKNARQLALINKEIAANKTLKNIARRNKLKKAILKGTIELLTWAIILGAFAISMKYLKKIPADGIKKIQDSIIENLELIYAQQDETWFKRKTGWINPWDATQKAGLSIASKSLTLVNALTGGGVDIIMALSFVMVAFTLLFKQATKGMSVSFLGLSLKGPPVNAGNRISNISKPTLSSTKRRSRSSSSKRLTNKTPTSTRKHLTLTNE